MQANTVYDLTDARKRVDGPIIGMPKLGMEKVYGVADDRPYQRTGGAPEALEVPLSSQMEFPLTVAVGPRAGPSSLFFRHNGE